jgi:hypothetical protein
LVEIGNFVGNWIFKEWLDTVSNSWQNANVNYWINLWILCYCGFGLFGLLLFLAYLFDLCTIYCNAVNFLSNCYS